MERDKKQFPMMLLRKWKVFRKVGRFIRKVKTPSEEEKRQMVKINHRMGRIFDQLFQQWGQENP